MKHSLTRIVVLTITPILALTACRDATGGLDGRIDPEVYVAVMGELADLSKYPPPATDAEDRQAQTDSAREEILNVHGVSAPELLAFAKSAGSNPTLMETLAEQIATIADSLGEIRASLIADTIAVLPDTMAEMLEGAPVDAGLRSPADSVAAQHRFEMDSIRRAMKLPPR